MPQTQGWTPPSRSWLSPLFEAESLPSDSTLVSHSFPLSLDLGFARLFSILTHFSQSEPLLSSVHSHWCLHFLLKFAWIAYLEHESTVDDACAAMSLSHTSFRNLDTPRRLTGPRPAAELQALCSGSCLLDYSFGWRDACRGGSFFGIPFHRGDTRKAWRQSWN